jgi:S1-C subfamily serine protease
LVEVERVTNARYSAYDDMRELVGLLDAYEAFISLHYKVSRSTQDIFARTRDEIITLVPERSRRPLISRSFNPHYLAKVDRAVQSANALNPNITRIIENVRAAQPAVVLIDRASGFNINSDGTILTNAHVAKELKRVMKVQFPNGDTFDGECVHIDEEMDLALVKVLNPRKELPFVRFSPDEVGIGTDIVLIGQPDTYDHWHVSTGKILNYHPHPHIAEEGHPLGGIEHNGWTFWGNSGSPLLTLDGLVVGAHNTYDARRTMRCGVRYEPIISFLRKTHTSFEFGHRALQR